jgi:hypothetical protein
MRAMAMAMRVVGNKKADGGMAMATVTRMVSEQWQWQQRGQW